MRKSLLAALSVFLFAQPALAVPPVVPTDPNGNPLGYGGVPLTTGGATGTATASPTVSTSAYSAGYDVGGLITLNSLVRSGATSGMVQSVLAYFADAQPNAQLYAVLFNANPSGSTITDHAAIAIAAADQPKIIAVVPLTYCQQTGTPTTCEALQLAISYANAASGGPLYMALVTQSAITLGSTSDLKITVTGPQD
jgi:hypothetical protein